MVLQYTSFHLQGTSILVLSTQQIRFGRTRESSSKTDTPLYVKADIQQWIVCVRCLVTLQALDCEKYDITSCLYVIIPVNGLTLASMVASEYLVNKSSVLTIRVKGPGRGGGGGGGGGGRGGGRGG